jgi:hypothetical protein
MGVQSTEEPRRMWRFDGWTNASPDSADVDGDALVAGTHSELADAPYQVRILIDWGMPKGDAVRLVRKLAAEVEDHWYPAFTRG